MRKNLVFGLMFIVFISGCASLEGPGLESEEKRAASVKESRQLRVENQALKEKVKALEEALTDATKKQKVIFKMPSAVEIQTALKNAGIYKGKLDGQIGSSTKEAIKKFQEQNGLNGDGVMGTRTWEKLSGYLKQE